MILDKKQMTEEDIKLQYKQNGDSTVLRWKPK